ncbi:AAA family ATPase [uncultured Megasphaera sp.]|uniref:AAA family ATPase n=1 Tax=uncultured Megasphaera sp. TaxID=165188 RepID=UPI0025E8D722|nr:AAA family ATPase [uncultured Megasphaera sp.]
MRWKMPVGIEDFRELRQGPYYFVDKTEFICRSLDDHSKVTLFTRPRRFGKTLTMSMLEWFFSLEKADESGSLFDGLAISGESAYMQQRGQYPVLFVSLKDIRDDTWEMMQETFRSTISTWCLHYDYLCHSKKVQTGLKARLQALEMQQGNQGEMGLALFQRPQ